MAWYYYLIISLLLLVLAFEIYHAKPHWNIWQKLKFNKKPKKLALELLREQYAPYEVKWSKVSLNPSVDLSKMYYNSRPVRDSDQLVAMSYPNYDRQRQYMVVIGISFQETSWKSTERQKILTLRGQDSIRHFHKPRVGAYKRPPGVFYFVSYKV
jgi:hypothetical protein